MSIIINFYLHVYMESGNVGLYSSVIQLKIKRGEYIQTMKPWDSGVDTRQCLETNTPISLFRTCKERYV